MKPVTRFISIALLLGVLIAVCSPANAGAYIYSGKRKKVNCGIVVLSPTGSSSVPQNETDLEASSKLFIILDAIDEMKPPGWTLENPLAQSVDANNMPIDKSNPLYWMVNLAAVHSLSNMDILYLPASGTVSLTEDEREKLRRFVDGGGVLWVDNSSSTSPLKFSDTSPFFIYEVGFATNTSCADAPVSIHHPLVSMPYVLDDASIANLGILAGGGTPCYYQRANIIGTTRVPTSFDVLYDVINSNSFGLTPRASVVANAYGSGRVVATANAIGKAICSLYAPMNLPSLKFAYNVLAYASSWTNLRKDPRHSGSSIDTVGGSRLIEKWSLLAGAPTPDVETAAVMYKNVVFYTIGDTVYALEQNGDTNNGYWKTGPNGEVVIWKWSEGNGSAPGGKLSSPTLVTMPDPNNNCSPIEAVLVMSESGTVYALDAFPPGPAPGLIGSTPGIITQFNTSNSSGKSSKPCPPICINGWIYAVGGDGRLYAYNPCLEKYLNGNPSTDVVSHWTVPDPQAVASYTVTPRCGPAFGYMKNATSGAVVGMVYWYGSPNTAIPGLVMDRNDHIYGVPVTVSNDRVNPMSRGTGGLETIVRVTYSAAKLLAPDSTDEKSAIRIVLADGIHTMATTGVYMNQGAGGAQQNGTIRITTSAQIPTDARIYASYSLAYLPSVVPSYLSLEIEPKYAGSSSGATSQPNPTLIKGSPALGPDNLIYINGYRDPSGSAANAGGSILAYVNNGTPTSNTLKWHYFLHSGADSSNSGYFSGMNYNIPAVVVDKQEDPTSKQRALIPMKNPQPSPSPAISNGKLFVTVSGDQGGPQGALLCLKANPEFVIRITQSAGYTADGRSNRQPKQLINSTTGRQMNVKLWQPNLIVQPDNVLPLMSARPIPSDMIDYQRGTITFTDFTRIKLQDIMQVMTNTFSPSLPVSVFLDNVEVPIDWTTWGPSARDWNWMNPGVQQDQPTSDSVDLSGWNNLLWYYIVPPIDGKPCTGVHSPPVVIGDTVYFTTDDGYLIALNTETGENQADETSQTALWTQKITTNTTSTLNANTIVSISGSNGVLLAPGPDGLHAFNNQPTLVADNNRIIEVDGAGEISWSLDAIAWPAVTPKNGDPRMPYKSGPINKPSKVRYTGTGEMLLVNSGADQVCRIDKSGRVRIDGVGVGNNGNYIRWIYDKFVDPKHLLRSGQPLQIQAPTDALLWQEVEPLSGTNNTPAATVHCLIADSGNHRIVDLVYRLVGGLLTKYDGTSIAGDDPDYHDATSGFVLPELNWVSKTDSTNEQYTYNCLQLVLSQRSGHFCQDIWASCPNYSATGSAVGSQVNLPPDVAGSAPSGVAGLGGAIFALAYRWRDTGTPQTGPGQWQYTFPTGAPETGTIVARCDRIRYNGQVIPMACPRFFQVVDFPEGRSMLICDNYGVYQADIQADPNTPPVVANNHIWDQQYRALARLQIPNSSTMAPLQNVPLLASSVQLLPNKRWLIANSYAGTDPQFNNKFNGEVFEYDFSALGSGLSPITWYSPKLQVTGSNGPNLFWKQVMDNSYIPEQPRSALRQ